MILRTSDFKTGPDLPRHCHINLEKDRKNKCQMKENRSLSKQDPDK